jgi:hypothetical protein
MSKHWKPNDTLLEACQSEEIWGASSLDLALVYEHTLLSPHQRVQLLRHVWGDPSLLGVVDEPHEFGQPWKEIHERDVEQEYKKYYGCVQITTEAITGCYAIFLDDEEDTTWFNLCIPVGLLGLIFPVKHPLGRQENKWIGQVDRTLATIGMNVYREFPFTLAVLSEEAAGMSAERILMYLTERAPDLLLPEGLFHRAGVTPYGLRSPEGLWWTGGKETLLSEND